MGLCSERPNATMRAACGAAFSAVWGTAGPCAASGARHGRSDLILRAWRRAMAGEGTGRVGLSITGRQWLGTGGVIILTGLAVAAMGVADAWVGDLVAMLWMVGTFLTPWLVGIALVQHGSGLQGRLIGAATSASVVLIPSVTYAIIQQPDFAEIELPLLWATFTPLSLALGAIATPVGARVRRR